MAIKKTSVSSISIAIIDSISKLINDPEFVDRHKKAAKYFIRNRTLGFELLILYLISILTKSMQAELNSFFKRIESSDTNIYTVTNSAFTQARAKLKYSAFLELDYLQTELFYQNVKWKKWYGFRLVAIDGSTLYIPSNEKTQKEFGISQVNAKGQKVVLARISEAFDPLNHITIDAAIRPFVVSEHTMMLQHLNKLRKGDLAIYDRNYPGFWIYKIHKIKEIDFCMRVQLKNRGKFIEAFVKSGEMDSIVDVPCATREAKQKCEELNLDTQTMRCRLIRIELKNGEIEILITSLLDQEAFPYECFQALYHLRWPVEEDYKFLKCRIELANFSGKSVEAIYQDFYAKIFSANLTSILAYDANIEIEKKFENRKLDYKINWTNAIENMKESAFLLFIRANYKSILEELHVLFQVNPVAVRPDRTFKRWINKNKPHVSMCYKQ